jgi:hypothetical protein
MGGGPRVPRPGGDPGSLGKDVVAVIGNLAQLLDGLIQVAALGGVPHCGAVKGAVEELVRGGHTPGYRMCVLHICLSAVRCDRG